MLKHKSELLYFIIKRTLLTLWACTFAAGGFSYFREPSIPRQPSFVIQLFDSDSPLINSFGDPNSTNNLCPKQQTHQHLRPFQSDV
jgi:hypothetical protein